MAQKPPQKSPMTSLGALQGSLGGYLHFVTVVAAGNLGIQFHPHAVLAHGPGRDQSLVCYLDY